MRARFITVLIDLLKPSVAPTDSGQFAPSVTQNNTPRMAGCRRGCEN
jgi:hypothetical protein